MAMQALPLRSPYELVEYSGKNKPAFRNGGNRQTGIQETALAA
jgi:hypothetical protein